jgi:VWFA-related protein
MFLMFWLAHSRRPLTLLFCIFGLLAGASLIGAREQQTGRQRPDKKEDQTATIRVDTDLVSIEVTVTDQTGRPSTALLRAEDFAVYEDGVRQKITNFATTDVPFNLVLLIDTSGSTRDEVALMRRAARRFLNELRPRDRVAVIQFNETVELLEDLTSDRAKIEKAINLLQPGAGTSFYDALGLTMDEVLKKIEGRRAVVALTDGVDSYGHYTFDQVLPEIEQAGVSLYFLELDTEAFTEAGMMRDCWDDRHFKFSRKQLKKYREGYAEDAEPGQYDNHCQLSPLERRQVNQRLYESARRELRELAEKTGGRVYPVKQLQQLEPVYAQIARELRTQYSLGYYSTNEKRDGQWRALRIEVKRPGLVAHTKPGYRAPKD